MLCEKNAKNSDCVHPRASLLKSNGYYVCRDCGCCVGEIYTGDYNTEKVFPFNPTFTISMINKADCRGKFQRLRLIHYQIQQSYARRKRIEGCKLIKILCGQLQLSNDQIYRYMSLFNRIYPHIQKNTLLRRLDILIPVIIYHFRDSVGVNVSFAEFSETVGIPKNVMYKYLGSLHKLLIIIKELI